MAAAGEAAATTVAAAGEAAAAWVARGEATATAVAAAGEAAVATAVATAAAVGAVGVGAAVQALSPMSMPNARIEPTGLQPLVTIATSQSVIRQSRCSIHTIGGVSADGTHRADCMPLLDPDPIPISRRDSGRAANSEKARS